MNQVLKEYYDNDCKIEADRVVMEQYTFISYLFQIQRRKLQWQGQTLTSFLPPSGKEMILYPFFVFLYSSENNTIVRLNEALGLRLSFN